MAEDQVTDGVQGAAPSGDGGSGQAPPQDSKPITFTQEQADALVYQAVDKATQEFRTWSGRRDKALIDQLSQTLEERLASVKTHTGDGALSPGFDFEHPEAAIEKIISQREMKRQTEAEKFNQAALAGMGRYMDSDPIFQNQNFGGKVLEMAITNIASLRRDLPPDVAGQMLIKDAALALGREGMKTQPALNRGAKQPFGSETAPAGGKKESTVYTGQKLSPTAAKLAEKWGYSAEALNKLFPQEK